VLRSFPEPQVETQVTRWCRLNTDTLSLAAGAAGDVEGTVWMSGQTDTNGSCAQSVQAQVGWGPYGSDPRTAEWHWQSASCGDGSANDDVHRTSVIAPNTPGTSYWLVYRVRSEAGWMMCDRGDGSHGAAEFTLTVDTPTPGTRNVGLLQVTE